LSCKPDDVELLDGLARVKRRNTHIRVKELAGWAHWNSSHMPAGLDGGIVETGVFTPTTLLSPDAQDRVQSSLTTTLMCDIAAIRIDRDTGQIKIVKYAIVHDIGRMLNPALAEGQLRGGFAHGLGAALLERLVYDGNGNFLAGTFADYFCPVAADLPPLNIGHAANPTDQNATGARGIGDGSSMNPPASIANAIADALGSADISVPAGPSRVWSMMNGLPPDGHLQRAVDKSEREHATTGALRGEGEQSLPGSPETVWRALFAVNKLAKIIPGCRKLVEVEPDRFEAEIVLTVAGMRSSYQAKIALTDKVEPRSIRISGRAEGNLGFGGGEAEIRLTPHGDNATKLAYRYHADVGGRVASVGYRMLDSVVRLLIGQFFKGLTRNIDPTGGRDSRMSAWLSRARHLFLGGHEKS
jgi:2-furoyl-CoA dehydrogenase large subunit